MRKPSVRLLALSASLVLAVMVAACGSSPSGGGTPAKTIKIGLVTDTGGLNDKSFNHLAAVGLAKAASSGNICQVLSCQGQLGVQGDVTESHANSDYVPNLTTYATKNYDLVIGVGFLMAESIGTVSGNFPNVHFAIIDGVGTDANGNDLKHANVVGLLFKEQEAGALVGTIAGVLEKDNATKLKKNTIGSVGGIKIPPVDHYIAGYQWAAKQVDPGITTLNGYSNNFSDPTKCSGVADDQINHGADIIFQVAGGCGNGALTQAGKRGVWSIGVDADQKAVDPSVIASALKRVDVATYDAVKEVKDGKFAGGVLIFGLANDGVGYQEDNLTLPSDVKTALTDMTNKIKSGSATVPDTVP
ncbi:MAG TPA: BMP family ABC transporter substrate-binding protein [Candidatus Dormibacteraeota bacterium]|nr:BMP family ABC transporter substrate-binding protein [Candidatus Dormibacteraeota bacterium]